MHLKSVRLFVESVLKYGLPPVYGVFLILISPNASKKQLCEKFWLKHISVAMDKDCDFIDKNHIHIKSEDDSISADPMILDELPFILYRVSANFKAS